MRLWGLASAVVFAMAASSAKVAAAPPLLAMETRLLVPSSAPATEPAPDEPEPAPSEVEPPPSLRIEPTLTPQLALSPLVEPKRNRWPLWRVLTGSALVVGGGVMFGFGLSAFAFDGICVPAPPAGVLACRRYYDTYSKGVALPGSHMPVSTLHVWLLFSQFGVLFTHEVDSSFVNGNQSESQALSEAIEISAVSVS